MQIPKIKAPAIPKVNMGIVKPLLIVGAVGIGIYVLLKMTGGGGNISDLFNGSGGGGGGGAGGNESANSGGGANTGGASILGNVETKTEPIVQNASVTQKAAEAGVPVVFFNSQGVPVGIQDPVAQASYGLTNVVKNVSVDVGSFGKTNIFSKLSPNTGKNVTVAQMPSFVQQATQALGLKYNTTSGRFYNTTPLASNIVTVTAGSY
jgi:hypothetical protein